ncbi:SPOR domain-containing protein [Sphingobium fontiphilum]|nr:SPOR domain-containing protein [Sphingobium fontiphilum]
MAQFSQAELVRPAEAQDLNGHLARLAANPRDVNALIGAGEAALALDDPQAAAGFFARADAIESGNGRIKAGQGRVMLAMQNPAQALTLFDQASRIGYNAANFAPYRALARDLTGDQAGAQEDYRTALKATPDDPELIRRYAASLGISGQVDAAEQVLKPLLYKSDRAAWRYRAFILAMNNRQDDARKIAEQTLPAQLATGLVPYLQKMPYLTGAQKAAAVHLGHFPARIGTQIAAITPTTAAPSANGAPAPATKVAETAPVAPETGPIRRAGVRRSSGDGSPRRAGDRRRKRDTQLAVNDAPAMPVAPAEPEPVPPPPPAPQPTIPLPSAATAVVQPLPEKPAPKPVAPPEVKIAARDAAPGLSANSAPVPASTPASAEAKADPAKVAVAPAPLEPETAAPKPSVATLTPGSSAVRAPSLAPAVQVAMAPRREVVPGPPAPVVEKPAPATETPAPQAASSPAPAPVDATSAGAVEPAPATPADSATAAPPPDPQATRTLADIIRAIDVPDSELRHDVAPVDLTEIEKIQAARRAAQEAAAEKAKKVAAARAKAEADARAKAEAAEKKRLADNPSRNWVQVGVGQSRSALGFTMKKLRARYSVLAPQDAWAASWGRTNRLLVGPFASFARAKAVEEELKAKGADVFAWQSKAGEEVDRIGN